MSNVYCPAHVVVILRRLVNFVSTLSISNHYILHNQHQSKLDDPSRIPDDLAFPPGKPSSSQVLEWPRWACRRNWSGGEKLDVLHKMRGVGIDQATVNMPKWTSGNWAWPSLFSFQPEINPPRPDDPPRTPEKPPRDRGSGGGRPPRVDIPPTPKVSEMPSPPDVIHQLLVNPALYDPLRTPRYPIVLCHGLYGFDSRGPSSFPSMRMHYWSNVLRILRGRIGAEVIVTSVPGTGSISSRAARLDEQLQLRARGRGVNFLAHSMGGLDCRHLISHIKPSEYAPLSLTTISTPHRGSPFMDWCAVNLGLGELRQQEKELTTAVQQETRRKIEAFSSGMASEDAMLGSKSPASGKQCSKKEDFLFNLSLSSLPSSFTTLILSIVDSPAYANLTSAYLNNTFNPATPDDPHVKYWSVAGRLSARSVNIWHPFWLPKMVLDGVEESEREKLKKLWEEQAGETLSKERQWGQDTPLWANEREWGNDGLVTVQSAKWGDFLGIMEGCDHWEMRGARGIEFGVDLPGIPSIGLGSTATSAYSSRLPSNTPTAQGDGWGFGDWARFVTAWKKSDNDTTSKAGGVPKLHHHDPASTPAHDESLNKTVNAWTSSSPPKDESSTEKRERERLADDDIVRSTTDSLSVVFDWLIDRVPAPKQILGPGVIGTTSLDDEALKQTRVEAARAVGAAASTLNVGLETKAAGVRGQNPTSPASVNDPSEIKQRMNKEGRTRQQNELANKEDLERFYVALARKMYDEGL